MEKPNQPAHDILLGPTYRYLDFVATPATIVTGLEFGDAELSAHVRDEVVRIEGLIETELSRGDEVLREAVLHLLRAGGKRFRPLFTVLSAQFGPKPDAWHVIVGGAVVELVHLATLYHDDVMDQAEIRRGVSSVNARWSNNIAILAGDFLFMAATRLASAARLGDIAGEVIAETCGQLVTGQVRETRGAAANVDCVDHYMKVVYEKTGCLLATAGWLGATFAGAEVEQAVRLRRIGGLIGTAFQMSDDIIDIVSDTEETGKEPGTDLREGIHTLPVLYALREIGPDADRLRQLLAGPVENDADLAEALRLVRMSEGMVRAKGVVAEHAAQARDELANLPDGPSRDALATLVDYTINRHG